MKKFSTQISSAVNKQINPEIQESNQFTNSISDLKRDGQNLFGLLYSNYKRHTVYKPVESLDFSKSIKRRNAYDYINHFTSDVLPKIETFVERRLLDKFKLGLNRYEKELVEDAYRLRKYITEIVQVPTVPKELINQEEKPEELTNNYEKIHVSFEGTGFKYHTFEDIGKYVYFPLKKIQEVFSSSCYGEYLKEYEKTKSFSVMCREEAVKLAHTFSTIKTAEERSNLIDIEAIINGRYNFKENLKNYEYFSLFFQDIAYSLLKFLEKSHNYEYKYLFTNPEIFDSLVTILTKNLIKNTYNVFIFIPEVRDKIFEKIITKMHEKFANKFLYRGDEIVQKEIKRTEVDLYPFSDFAEVIEQFKVFNFKFENELLYQFCEKSGIPLDENNIEKYKKMDERINSKGESVKTSSFRIYLTSHWEFCEYQWRPEEMRTQLPGWKGFNTGALLIGEAGNGKSMIMTYLHAWAKENNWFVIPIFNLTHYLQRPHIIERTMSGMYVQPELAKLLLIDLKIINYKILQETKVDLSDYGKYDFAGNRDGDADAVPILWNARNQVYTDSWKEFNSIPEEEILLVDYPHHYKRLRDFLPRPRTLLEIVNYGIENSNYANNAVFELVNALAKSINIKTMMLVDDYNELFKPTMYDSYKYANYKRYDLKIPPHDIALPRLFMKFDYHFFKQGVKICAISLDRYQNHNFKPELIHFPRGYSLKIENLKLNDTRNAIDYYMSVNYVNRSFDEMDIQRLWQLTQGNWRQLKLNFESPIPMAPSQERWLERETRKKEISSFKNI